MEILLHFISFYPIHLWLVTGSALRGLSLCQIPTHSWTFTEWLCLAWCLLPLNLPLLSTGFPKRQGLVASSVNQADANLRPRGGSFYHLPPPASLGHHTFPDVWLFSSPWLCSMCHCLGAIPSPPPTQLWYVVQGQPSQVLPGSTHLTVPSASWPPDSCAVLSMWVPLYLLSTRTY